MYYDAEAVDVEGTRCPRPSTPYGWARNGWVAVGAGPPVISVPGASLTHTGVVLMLQYFSVCVYVCAWNLVCWDFCGRRIKCLRIG